MMEVKRHSHWQEDLAFLIENILSQHANPFHSISKTQFDKDVESLLVRIPNLQPHEIVVEMSRIVASIGDGHTSFSLDSNASLGFHRYPLRFYSFSDGVVVYEATTAYQNLLGAYLVGINSHTVEEVLSMIATVVSGDNLQMRHQKAYSSMNIPEILHALEIIPAIEQGNFTLKNVQGEIFEVSPTVLETTSISQWIGLSDNSVPKALWQRNPARFYWFEYLQDQKLIYVNYRIVKDMPDETIKAFCNHLFEFVENNSVERLVLDIRQNSGGDNRLNQPLVHGLICNQKVNQRGRLFTIIGRHTFSAAMNLAVDLERNTKTLFVGEPTGASPNHYGENADVTLPHSRITLTVSKWYWQSSVVIRHTLPDTLQ
jgi:hypothetical protein